MFSSCILKEMNCFVMSEHYQNIISKLPCTVSADELNADFGFIREEHEHLISRVVVVVNKHDQVGTGWTLLAKRK